MLSWRQWSEEAQWARCPSGCDRQAFYGWARRLGAFCRVRAAPICESGMRMNYECSSVDPVRLLWTGGWDSTFQLLQLLLSEKRRVEPHYLFDEDRPSASTELLTMKRIRTRIREIDEAAAELLQPTKLSLVSEIPTCPRVTHAYESIKSGHVIGRQYDWLARYCEDQGISRLQLCIHKDDKAATVVAPVTTKAHRDWRPVTLDDRYSHTDVHVLFRRFEFPVLERSKTDMAHIARERGWGQIMEMTWFCHNPMNGKPCGRCNPCIYTIEEGLAWRVPIHRRALGRLHRASVQPAKKCVKKLVRRLHR